MAYRIFFSGLMVFVEHGGFKQVDVLLLNPCADHHKPGEGEHEGASHERECLDRHLPQLTVKATDIAEWNLAGTLHGCGWRHFDLTGKTVFADIERGGYIEGAVDHKTQPDLDPYSVDPFGDMRQVSFDEGIVDMHTVLGKDNAKLDEQRLAGLLAEIGKDLVAAKVRLPEGALTALAPLDNSARQVVNWTIGKQKLLLMCETVMFQPTNKGDQMIHLGGDEFVTLRTKPDVTVWITDEPRVRTRFQPQNGFRGVSHFKHYYSLLQGGLKGAEAALAKDQEQNRGPKPLSLTPDLAFNTDTPPCPSCLVHAVTPLF
jgi:hypothetical protein